VPDRSIRLLRSLESTGAAGLLPNFFIRYGIGSGKYRYCGLGAYPLVGLAEARKRAQDAREKWPRTWEGVGFLDGGERLAREQVATGEVGARPPGSLG